MPVFRRILVPHDFSHHADHALKLAADLVEAKGSLVVMHAIVPFTPITDLPPGGISAYVSPAELVDGARQQLERITARVLKGRKRPKLTLKVEIGDPYQRIVANARGADAIVMTTAGRTGLPHLLIGSVAEKVVRHSPIPVLTLRPRAGRRRG